MVRDQKPLILCALVWCGAGMSVENETQNKHAEETKCRICCEDKGCAQEEAITFSFSNFNLIRWYSAFLLLWLKRSSDYKIVMFQLQITKNIKINFDWWNRWSEYQIYAASFYRCYSDSLVCQTLLKLKINFCQTKNWFFHFWCRSF